MLEELTVANLGLIEAAQLEPGPGFVVVTGETGAGKTLLLGALGLLAGSPARRDLIGPWGDELSAGARFAVGTDELVVRRRVLATGRSRAYCDGEMVPAAALREVAAPLMEIVAQHEHLALARPAGVRRLVDAALDPAGRAALEAYAAVWARLEEQQRDAAALGGDRRALERELDMSRFQADEIRTAGFAPGDDARLGAEAARLRNAVALIEGIARAAAALDERAGPELEEAAVELERLSRIDPDLDPVAAQASELAGLVAQLQGDLARYRDGLDEQPERLDQVEGRLARLGELRRKYGSDLEAVLAFGEAAAARAAELDGLLQRAGTLEEALIAARQEAESCGETLRRARADAAARIAGRAEEHLRDLGFRHPVVSFDVAPVPAGPAGADRIELRFASDRSLDARPVARVASGGELSRLVLALRLAAGASDAPVLVFDEIDAGIGGTTALAMGRKLAALAEGRQVLCVSHLPQVAAFADHHVVVSRTGAAADVQVVTGSDRVEELSRMLAGLPDSERGRSHAEELLAVAARR